MPTREEIMSFIKRMLDGMPPNETNIWVAIYCLFLDYIHNVPRITDSNRLTKGIWVRRAKMVEDALSEALQCETNEVINHVDILMRQLYHPGTQRMNPVGIGYASSVVYLIDRFAGKYDWKIEARIGKDVFPNLSGFRRKSVDIVAFKKGKLYAVISSKWGIRHDRIRDPQEEAETYKKQDPKMKFYVITNEFDNGRLQHLLNWKTIDGVFHINRDLVMQIYGNDIPDGLPGLKNLTDLFPLFP
jgi:hypothetical protein